ncbi:TRAP transporter small permease [uncultured Oscillibacter sp.]|uniref:TRAP transporter small permease n=1 Tax=uncultured Oscillibacter sp. TaxID=876091 RepID=UPI0025D8060A|nr:TRAP transporter small permease [uncultured Oscillibacter sp.]
MRAQNQHPALTKLIQFDDATERLLMALGGATVAGFVLTVFTDVLFRTFFNPIVWMEEISRLLYMWSIFLGSAVAFRRGTHFKIDILHFNNPVVRRTLAVISYLLSVIFVIVLLYFGYKFALQGIVKKSLPSGIPLIVYRMSFPVSGIFMLLYCLEGMVENVFGIEIERKET